MTSDEHVGVLAGSEPQGLGSLCASLPDVRSDRVAQREY